MYKVYEIRNQFDEIIYIGYTSDIHRRHLEHKRYWTNTNKKKQLYQIARKKGWILNQFNVLYTFNKLSTAKLFEAYTISKQIIEYSNKNLTNQKIDPFRIFVNLSISEIKLLQKQQS